MLVVVAVIAVPWMLLIKPFYLRAQAKKKREDVGVSFANLEAGTNIQGEATLYAEGRVIRSRRTEQSIKFGIFDIRTDFSVLHC